MSQVCVGTALDLTDAAGAVKCVHRALIGERNPHDIGQMTEPTARSVWSTMFLRRFFAIFWCDRSMTYVRIVVRIVGCMSGGRRRESRPIRRIGTRLGRCLTTPRGAAPSTGATRIKAKSPGMTKTPIFIFPRCFKSIWIFPKTYSKLDPEPNPPQHK